MKQTESDIQNERHLETLRKFAETKPSELLPLLDVIPIGICITNQYGYFKNVNQAYCNFYGYSRDELIGNSFTLVVPEANREYMQELHDQFMGKKYELHGKWEVKDKYGNICKIISNAAYLPATDTEGPQKMTFIAEVKQTDTVLNDLNLTVNLLQKKISAQEVAQQLSNHDLRNNLASILQMVELLLDKQPTDEQKIWLNHLKERSGHTLELLGTSLDYSKMEQGQYEPRESLFDIIKAIRGELAQLHHIIQRKAIQVLLFYKDQAVGHEQEIMVEADKFYIERMFHNLLTNALEASPEDQQVTVSLEENSFLKITIHNEGVIPADVRDHFFDKFTTSGKKKGTGLGTYIAKLVVEMHEGSIAYRSSEEEGTDIVILLPRRVLSPSLRS